MREKKRYYKVFKNGMFVGTRHRMPKGSQRATMLKHNFGYGWFDIIPVSRTKKIRRTKLIVKRR